MFKKKKQKKESDQNTNYRTTNDLFNLYYTSNEREWPHFLSP